LSEQCHHHAAGGTQIRSLMARTRSYETSRRNNLGTE
jgi:hypothetical protein